MDAARMYADQILRTLSVHAGTPPDDVRDQIDDVASDGGVASKYVRKYASIPDDIATLRIPIDLRESGNLPPSRVHSYTVSYSRVPITPNNVRKGIVVKTTIKVRKT